LFGQVWKRWANEFVDQLHRAELPGKVIWKMNCRAVDRELFIRMREAGLYLVYMGLESGSEQGLETLHKQITVEQNYRAVNLLKDIGLMFEYGFMLLDPSSTFEQFERTSRS
jgi:anaerobic magnesium-protoporphyrin IX monomethyl ester cyclase